MLIMKMSVLEMKRISTMGSDRSEKEIVGYCVRDISRFALGHAEIKKRVNLRNNLQAQIAQNKFIKKLYRLSC